MIEIENAVAASSKHFDLVVDAFHEAIGVSVQEVVGNFDIVIELCA